MPAPVIMVHGAFCGGWAFDRFRQPFEAAGHVCHAPDLPGHAGGGDRIALTGMSISRYAAVTADAIRACGEPPIVIGHSMGGLVAAMAACRAEVRALVMLSPSAPWGVAGATMEEAVSAVGLYSLGVYWAQAIEPDYGMARQFSLDRIADSEQQSIFDQMTPESGRALWETLNWWLDPFMTTRITSAAIAAPTLAIAGGKDRINAPGTVERTAALLDADFTLFPDMSHWTIGEPGWERVADKCLTWLGRQARAAA